MNIGFRMGRDGVPFEAGRKRGNPPFALRASEGIIHLLKAVKNGGRGGSVSHSQQFVDFQRVWNAKLGASVSAKCDSASEFEAPYVQIAHSVRIRAMPGKRRSEWTEEELQYVESELAIEYANVSTSVISMVVTLAKTMVSPQEGRVKLLAVARKNLGR